MNVNDIGGADEALAYVTECQLATVGELAMKKSTPRRVLDRHIAIAQVGVDWLVRRAAWTIEKTLRPRRVVEDHDGSVRTWAEEIARRGP